MINLQLLQNLNVIRANRWHGGDFKNWSPLEWAGAMCGEAGEAANFAKKIKRIQTSLVNIDSRGLYNLEEYKKAVGKEVADTIIYSLLLAASVDINIEEAIREVFNKKSEEYGFPERI